METSKSAGAPAIRLHPDDDVAIAMRELAAGEVLPGFSGLGSSALAGVYRYAEPITTRGLVFMDAPGYDPMGATGQIASGANLVAFTTGRGSCFGCAALHTKKADTHAAFTPSHDFARVHMRPRSRRARATRLGRVAG